jgi:hypothetical protein
LLHTEDTTNCGRKKKKETKKKVKAQQNPKEEVKSVLSKASKAGISSTSKQTRVMRCHLGIDKQIVRRIVTRNN